MTKRILVVEDTEVGLAEIRAEFGDAVADAVGAITRRDGEGPDAYYGRGGANAARAGVQARSSGGRVQVVGVNTAQRVPDRHCAIDAV